jgi:hypothetical protein
VCDGVDIVELWAGGAVFDPVVPQPASATTITAQNRFLNMNFSPSVRAARLKRRSAARKRPPDSRHANVTIVLG